MSLGLVKAVPIIRYAIEVGRHSRETSLREPGALNDWVRQFGDPGKTLAAFPDQANNETAVRLIQLAQPLGLDLRSKKDRPGFVEPAGERALRQAVVDYYRSELLKTGGPIAPPGETLRAALEGCRPEIGAVIILLTESKPPVWKTRVSAGFEAPIPNLLAQIRLQKLLAAEALNRAYFGEAAESERALDASWNLNSSLRDRPDVISQLVGIAIARMQVGLARRVPIDPARWRKRFAEQDYRASLLKAMEVESVASFRRLQLIGSSFFDRASRADFLDLRRGFLVTLRDSRVSDGPVEFPQGKEPLSAGAIIEVMPLPNLAGAIRRADHLLADTELTDLILEARLLRGRLGHWPDEMPSLASRMPNARWIYVKRSDGRASLHLSRELRWEEQGPALLPDRYDFDS